MSKGDCKPYLCVCQLFATRVERDGDPYYHVFFSDGWETGSTWMPEDQFEAHCFPLQEDSRISFEDVERLVNHSDIESSTIGDKTTLVQVTLPTGFVFTEASSCVDPKNYDAVIGKEVCINRIIPKFWQHLGFVLQWARHGLTWKNPEEKK